MGRMLKNIYVRKADETFWVRAEAAAKRDGVALSVWLSRLIRNHIYETGAGQKKEQTPEEMLTEAMDLIARALPTQAEEATVS